MSQNLLAAVEQEDHDDVVRPMVLTRLGAGITASAKVEIGHHIDFGGLQMEITSVTHHHEPANGDLAPRTAIYGVFNRPLSDPEIETLRKHGFKDI